MAENQSERPVSSYENDGEKITYEKPSEEIEREKWERKKRRSVRNAFGSVAVARISTQGPEK